MLPWKSFVRSVSIVTLLTAGAMAAGQNVVPFTNASRGVAPVEEVDEPPVVEEETPDVDPIDEVVDEETTTTTTAPEVETPDIESDDDPEPVVPEAVEKPEKSRPEKTATTGRPAPASDTDKECGGSKPKGDHNFDGHCDNGWHNKDAEFWAKHGAVRPDYVPSPSGAPEAADEDEPKADDDADDDGGESRPEKADRGDRPESAPGQLKKNS